ncbi:flippase [Paraburkholderia lacunae]|uniref:Flippase n=1 Tax=Paraburkholderia lacunae TaxID=2211104 RepID=A0A370NDI3_9BURK|nr:flippase [Paraburkholderia lacunae]RDK03667.1 flippase [Paraburkholderia lacunae]
MEKSILKNIAINFAGSVVPTFISLATVPAYLHLMGVDRYGVINLVWALIGYFSVLDLGTSLATENQIAKVRDADDGSVERIFWSACALNLGTGIIGGLIVYFGAFLYIQHGVKIEPAFQREVMASLPWIAIAVPLANVTWVFAGAITAVERFASFNTNQTIGTILFQVLPLAAIYFISPSLAVAIPAAVCARLIAGVMLGMATWRALNIRRVCKPEWPVIAELFGYGRWLLLFSGAGMISQTLDRVLIGSMLGARFVAYYATPQNLVNRLNILPGAMLRTLFPRLSASAREDADQLARGALAFLNGAFTPCVIVALFALEPFLTIWLGAQMAVACAPVGRILIVGVWLAGQSSILGILIQAQANPAAVAKVSWIQLPVFIGALWLSIHFFGIAGAASVIVVKALFDYCAFLYFSRLHVKTIVANMLAHLAFLVLASVLAGLVEALPVAAVVGAVLVAANLGWSLHVSSELRSVLKKGLRRVPIG